MFTSRQDVPDGGFLVLGVPGVPREAGGGRGVTLTRRLPARLVLRAWETETVRVAGGSRRRSHQSAEAAMGREVWHQCVRNKRRRQAAV